MSDYTGEHMNDEDIIQEILSMEDTCCSDCLWYHRGRELKNMLPPGERRRRLWCRMLPASATTHLKEFCDG